VSRLLVALFICTLTTIDTANAVWSGRYGLFWVLFTGYATSSSAPVVVSLGTFESLADCTRALHAPWTQNGGPTDDGSSQLRGERYCLPSN
jgi:hypothetical protein